MSVLLQPPLPGFETPFHNHLNPANRWVVLAKRMPCKTGADGINPRVVIGSLIIKHMCDLSDRETVHQIQENMYMQYFLGFSSFSDQEPFDASLFVEFRKRLGAEQINAINEKILNLSIAQQKEASGSKEKDDEPPASVTILKLVNSLYIAIKYYHMARPSSNANLTEAEIVELHTIVRSTKVESRLKERSFIILDWHEGKSYDQTEALRKVSRRIVAKWRSCFLKYRIDGLVDAARSGKPVVITEAQKNKVIQLACSKPDNGYSNWSQQRIGNI